MTSLLNKDIITILNKSIKGFNAVTLNCLKKLINAVKNEG